MAKYSKEFKLKVVRDYLNGPLGYKLLARKYGMKSIAPIIRWAAVYNKYGADGLEVKKTKAFYPVQFKLDVLSFMKRTGASENETALQFGLTNPPIIAAWKKKFLDGGAEALDQPRGRPPMSDKAKNTKKKKQETQNKELTREQKLERENELLRLELAYLKKLKAFQMDPEGYLEKHRQRYHSNSKKNSD